ncbi:MAG: class I SAM-dependent methyltransferase [Desulfobulbaceae bacterium]|nr:class I SAM-dependent methyltransferase [Desulfobulbaceae bacterium]
MKSDYRKKLFDNYAKTHTDHIDQGDQDKLDWFKKYIFTNYIEVIQDIDKDSSCILEIGCNKGYLVNVLSGFGFKNLIGIDLSVDDLEKAKELNSEADFFCMDAFDYLQDKKNFFDLIIMKAVLEHVSKEKTLLIIKMLKDSLKSGGTLLVDVPNMDWLFASHERYMDFTHEVGFTKESLSQVLYTQFSSVSIFPVDHQFPVSFYDGLRTRIGQYLISKLLTWADAQGAGNHIWSRNIIAIATKKDF